MKKRVVTLVLCLALLLSLGAVSALAADDDVTIQITADKEVVEPGDTVTYTVALNNPAGKAIEGAQFSLKSDAGLTYSATSDISKSFMMGTVTSDPASPTAYFVIATADNGAISDEGVQTGTANNGITDKTITLFKISYQVSASAAFGTSLKVAVDTDKLVDVFDNNTTTLGYAKVDATVTVKHTEETIPAVAATCTEDGKTEGIKCSVCGEVIKAQEVVKATGHTWGAPTGVVEATTEAEGYTGDKTCSVCGTIEKGQVIPKIESGDPGTDTPTGLKGDVNGDGYVDTDDAMLIMQYDVGLLEDSDLALALGDVNGDGYVDTDDAMLIMQYDVGLIDEL